MFWTAAGKQREDLLVAIPSIPNAGSFSDGIRPLEADVGRPIVH